MTRAPATTSIVTGAAGFAGTWLCRALQDRGHRVVGWIRRAPLRPVPGVEYELVDVVDGAACARAVDTVRPDQLFHLAALTNPREAARDPARARAVNVAGTRNVFRSLPDHVAAVLASTVHVYGPPSTLPVSEAAPRSPRGVYAVSKSDAEDAALAAHPTVVVARAFHHTGPGQSPEYALADWARQLASGRRTLHAGDVTLRRDYSDVRDIVAGYILLAERGPRGRAVNLCAGRAPRLVDMIRLMAPDDPPQIRVDTSRLRRDDARELRGDPTLARTLGWRPSRPLSETLLQLRRSFAIC